VLDALAAYQEGVQGKTYVRGIKQPPDPFLTYSGFKSWGAFEKGARYFSVSSNGSEIQITPSVPAPKGGYLHQPNLAYAFPRMLIRSDVLCSNKSVKFKVAKPNSFK